MNTCKINKAHPPQEFGLFDAFFFIYRLPRVPDGAFY